MQVDLYEGINLGNRDYKIEISNNNKILYSGRVQKVQYFHHVQVVSVYPSRLFVFLILSILGPLSSAVVNPS